MGRPPRRKYPLDARVATRIFDVRTHRGLTQNDLAVKARTTRMAISAIEANERAITLREAVDICAVLDIELSALVAEAPLTVTSQKTFA